MNGTAATMGIEENLALASRRGKMPLRLKQGIKAAERDDYKELLEAAGPGPGRPSDLQGGSAFRRTAAGAYPSDGYLEEAEASASG